ncbi:MAG: molybdenum cofactor biosynthesis protein C [Candidatus Schekmanbacteria bacterium RIFCSPHIGHO2_02_FULL_38_11]|uniref:Cyclic pyranopterin monophosphate synthase n=1 Tax=Candidatus Schekmanbacteria bacterium RIFCSPLOWO2_12_FULL_38_15 TaxID=1817883 RepID=A0A1F7SH01_9BACT|nr:MAG: molybdenum cofactor biosynthesis protein C [Candidatus Schekmanbacteria bacterium GWA2_38_9]OGL49672.1 MAG: molybdenum cofactor biosynthesis protein C [Candidatus Schekmanbacteria bacterium RIFCSPLOWO2_02_FULL_38_14]OGL51914.1 MAG: molybdenum cofactor biosynthesis protein C [Candidatus Schekmanbacteria bacterium RIFCSPHIGHO2_02_FULL_38_11]OGL53025.1 MAG: molybdenum cofactor biosynthesis protein C [Candidatus Schekmanbacteria bacterium RIFCSPLOWO2_12_FULL_38_15]
MKLTHFDRKGKSQMVDVSDKNETIRVAIARGMVLMKPETFKMINNRKIAKGDVFEVARLAGVMAAKRTGELIPLCHPLKITSINIDFKNNKKNIIEIQATVKACDKTGVEMEALTAVSIAALTIYDMCKSVDREMEIREICLLEKSGGKSGHFKRSKNF